MVKTNIVDWTTITNFVVDSFVGYGIPREDAFYLASASPAEYMGLNKGKIAVGYDADFIVVNENNDLLTTVIGGRIFEE